MTEERLTHDFDPLEPETFTSAHERYKDMRRKCPVAHSNEFNGFWALFKYRDIERVLKDYRNFVTSVQNVVPKVAFTGRRPPLHLDPPEHTPYRRAINPFFSNQRMDMLKNDVRRMVAELLEPLLQREEGDISDEFAQKLPGYVFAKLFNLTQELAMDIKRCTAVYNRAVQRADDRMVKETSLKLYDIARRMIAMRKAEPMDPAEDIVSALLSATHNGEPLPEDMVLGAVRQLMVVGMIAPSVFVGNMAVHLSEHRDLQERLRSEPRLIPAAVEEYFRLFSPYRGFARTSKTDVVIGGRLIRKDEPIALVFTSANRDEDVFPEPDQFILHRPNIHQHIAFGSGPHQCPGAPLARMMMIVTLEELLTRTKSFEVAGEIRMTRWPEWGTLSVPLKFVKA
jgi:cytochrome P450